MNNITIVQIVKLAGEKVQVALVACATIVGYSTTTSAYPAVEHPIILKKAGYFLISAMLMVLSIMVPVIVTLSPINFATFLGLLIV